MARHELTALGIKHATKSKLRDGDGLWLHQAKGGTWSWVFIYIRKGKRREMGLGPYGRGTGTVSIVAAREKADEIRAILGRGGDPFTEMTERAVRIEARSDQVVPLTFKQTAEAYIGAMASKWRGRATLAGWQRFANVYTAEISTTPVAEVRTPHVLQVLEPIWLEKPETASKVRERLKLVLDYAKAKELRTGDNPAVWKGHLDATLPPPNKLANGHHAAAPHHEITGLVKALQSASGIGARALEFTILTAARSGETRLAVFSEFDLEKAIWTVPPLRMKTKTEHRVPLSPRAVEIVAEMAATRQSNYVFPGAKKHSPLSDMTLTKALKTAGGDAYTVHGMRSTFRDWAADETDHAREVAEAALSHSVGDKVEQAYRRGDALAKRRLLMDDWSAFVGGNHG